MTSGATVNIFYQHTLKTKQVIPKPCNVIRIYEAVFVKYRCPNTSLKNLIQDIWEQNLEICTLKDPADYDVQQPREEAFSNIFRPAQTQDA